MKSHAYRMIATPTNSSYAITQQLEDETWIATFPGFSAYGRTEAAALTNLASEIDLVVKLLKAQAMEATNSIEKGTEP